MNVAVLSAMLIRVIKANVSDFLSQKADDAAAIDKTAAAWLARGEIERLTPAERADLEAWLDADARHRGAYEAVGGVWSEMGGSEALAAQAARLRAETEPAPGLLNRIRLGALWDGLRPAAPVGAAGLAAVAALAVVLIVFVSGPEESGVQYADARETVIAEVRDEVLEDGSIVTLGAKSAIQVAFSPSERRVVLSEGVAFFSVEKDPARPFFVEAGETTVRVVGTQFDVHRGPEGVKVSVLEGVVEVFEDAPSKKADDQKQRLTAGQRAVASRAGKIAAVSDVSAREAGAWRTGRLIYDNASLREVIADANRYYDGVITFDAPALGDLKVSASFRTDEIDAMINTLTRGLPVEADRPSRGRIVLRERRRGA